MKVKPYMEEVVELVLQFLENQLGETAIAQQLREKHVKHVPEEVLKNNLLIKKGLAKSIKSYVQMDKRIKQYYMDRHIASEVEGEPMEDEKKTKNPRKDSTNSVQQSKSKDKK